MEKNARPKPTGDELTQEDKKKVLLVYGSRFSGALLIKFDPPNNKDNIQSVLLELADTRWHSG